MEVIKNSIWDCLRCIPSDETISVNLDDFESGKKNKLLIVGAMGSGKTTLAEFLSKRGPKIINGIYPMRWPRIKWKSCDTIYYNFIQKYFRGVEKTKEVKNEITIKVGAEVNKILKSNGRMIIEGAIIIDLYRESKNRELIMDQPMIILGMSALRSGIRGGIRNVRMERDYGVDKGWKELSELNMKYIERPLNLMRRDARKIPEGKVEKYKIPSLK
jgi:energy-coupling factor transporter ATP-binding protein EcfA2